MKCVTLQLIQILTILQAWCMQNEILADDFSSSESSTECFITRYTNNSGLHRELVTQIKISDTDHVFSEAQCRLSLVEAIPCGMYVDLFELAAGEEFGGPQFYSSVDIDVEKPQYLSASHTVYIFPESSQSEGHLEMSTTIPIHLRYHKPQSESDYATVVLPPPTLLFHCQDDQHLEIAGDTAITTCDRKNIKQCTWKILTCTNKDNRHGTLQFKVPVGREEHYYLVIYGTLCTTIAATLYLVKTIIQKSDTHKSESEHSKDLSHRTKQQ